MLCTNCTLGIALNHAVNPLEGLVGWPLMIGRENTRELTRSGIHLLPQLSGIAFLETRSEHEGQRLTGTSLQLSATLFRRNPLLTSCWILTKMQLVHDALSIPHDALLFWPRNRKDSTRGRKRIAILEIQWPAFSLWCVWESVWPTADVVPTSLAAHRWVKALLLGRLHSGSPPASLLSRSWLCLRQFSLEVVEMFLSWPFKPF